VSTRFPRPIVEAALVLAMLGAACASNLDDAPGGGRDGETGGSGGTGPTGGTGGTGAGGSRDGAAGTGGASGPADGMAGSDAGSGSDASADSRDARSGGDTDADGRDASLGDADAAARDVNLDINRDEGGRIVDAAQEVDGNPTGMCSPVGPAPTVVKVLYPKLFSQGADPSADPECTGVLNPERGIFQFFDLRNLGSVSGLRGQGYTLIYGKTLIDDYRDKDIDSALTNQLTASLASLRAAGLKVLPRFYYADDATSPDAPLDRVLKHIAQLAPLWQTNADVIAVLHPGFVGAWGEWHSSTNNLTDPAVRLQIFDALLQALPPDRMTMSRRPSFKKDAYGGPLTAATAFSGMPLSRVGHLNDCFLASADDMGTYQVAGEEQFAVDDSAFVPVGGETCAVNPPRSECASAMREMARLHWSFINTSYHQDVIQSWKDGGCYSTITCRLGYRLALLGHEVPSAVRKGEMLSLSVRLTNDGYAPPYNPRTVYLVVAGPERRIFQVQADPRRWAPGETVDLCLGARVPADLPAGSYQIGLWMPDPAATLKDNASYAIRLASGATWDAATATNLLDAHVIISD
jgi:hypothetical protein